MLTKPTRWFLAAVCAAILLSPASFANSGDVTVKIRNLSGQNKVVIGQDNYLEFWLTNDNALGGMSLGFRADFSVPITWVVPYGNKPLWHELYKIQEYGDAVNGFNLSFLKFTDLRNNVSADTFLFGGAAGDYGLAPHAVSTMLYDIKFRVAAGASPAPNGFCVDNIKLPPAGTWTMAAIDGSGGWAPTFQGQPNTSEQVPDAPAVCFDVIGPLGLPPVFTNMPGSQVTSNHCSPYAFDFDATEGGNTPPGDPVTFSTSVGTINSTTGALSVPPMTGCGQTNVVVTATNAYGKAAVYPFTITWTSNNPVITGCPTSMALVNLGDTYTLQLNATDADSCDSLVWTVAQIGGPAPADAFTISNTGMFTLNTIAPDDGGKTFQFTATATDPCGGSTSCAFSVSMYWLVPFMIKIEKTHNSLQGHYEVLSITKVMGAARMGGYDFLLAYDATGLIFTSAEIGAALKPAGCGWEYFTYRCGAQGNCNGPCPSGFLRIVAIADINNGANHPTCFAVPDGGELASLKFYVTNDRTYDCMYVPVRFAWFDCGDNGISSVTGDTLFISHMVFDFENTNPMTDPLYNITGLDCGMDPHYGGYCYQSCLVGQKYFPVPFIRFWNGGVDIVCADSIDARGDLNLNGIANEIADAVLYTNYFLYGISAFDPLYFEGSIAASDVNADGRALTVGDLVYLMRVIIGDALPYPKLAPFANSANVNVVNGVVSTEASTEVGAVYATFAVNGAYSVVNNSTMEVVNAESNGELKVLVYSGMSNMTNRLAAGSNNLFTVTGNVELKSVEVADYNGNMLNTRVAKTALPTAFALSQNVPNPFNPTTKIGLSLPTVSDWSVDIYNVAGQLVKSFNGRGIGNVTADWDASNVASGIYFYKATAGSFTDTKKMMVLK
jgi:hypothetical protein